MEAEKSLFNVVAIWNRVTSSGRDADCNKLTTVTLQLYALDLNTWKIFKEYYAFFQDTFQYSQNNLVLFWAFQKP